MIDSTCIRDILKNHIDSGKKKFIIYPFGINGVSVRNILNDYFNLRPCYIVDNEYSKYNVHIINKDELRKVFHADMSIILTIENETVNTDLIKELQEFVPKENIINIYAIMKNKKREIKKGFSLQDILPAIKVQTYNFVQGKIKVRMTYSNSNFWNAISSLTQAFCEDTSIDFALIIATANSSEEERIIKQLSEKGYRYYLFDEYQMEWDRPDILILTNSFDKVATQENSCREYARLIVVEDMQLIWYRAESADYFCEKQEKAYERHRPDFYLYDSLIYQEIKRSSYFSEKIVEMGNPKYDGIYARTQKKEYFGRWEKLRGKKSVLWAISHGVGITAFDIYAKAVFEYANSNPEMGLIFRPHSSFVDEMLEYGYWSKADLKKLKEYCDSTVNVVYDDSESYEISMAVSDGILTDVFCGIICSALPTLKPICVAYRSKEVIPCHKKLLERYYSAHDTKDIKRFFDMILNEKDRMLHLREAACKEYVKNFDGKNSIRVKEFVREKYIELMKNQE